MTKVSKGDFIEIEYTGRVKDSKEVFDTTDEKTAKENNLHGHDFGPKVICVGEEHVLKGIDSNLDGKEIGNEYEFNLRPEDAFGNKNAQLIQLIPTNKFRQQNIQPMPGLQLNIDGMLGTVKTVSGGRTLVDFNHPLAGREVSYKLKVKKKITDDVEKIIGYIKLSFGITDIKAEVNEGNAKITSKNKLPAEIKKMLGEKIPKLVPNIKNIEFIAENK